MRTPLSKRIRFEVLKRDSFKCQYCGAEAPGVVLQVDHIHPVSKGGSDEITNLVTSCLGCNSGKSDKLLSDSSAVAKAKRQLDELQDRREQLEMLMEWKSGLLDLNESEISMIGTYWERVTEGYVFNAKGKQQIKQMLARYSVKEVTAAMDEAARAYLKVEGNGSHSAESAEVAFSMLPRICEVLKRTQNNPELRELYRVRGILRKRLDGRYYDASKAMEWLEAAHSWSISPHEMAGAIYRAHSWSKFETEICKLIARERDRQENNTSAASA